MRQDKSADEKTRSPIMQKAGSAGGRADVAVILLTRTIEESQWVESPLSFYLLIDDSRTEIKRLEIFPTSSGLLQSFIAAEQ